MRDVTNFRPARQSTLRRGLTGLVVAVFMSLIGALVLDVRAQLDRLSTAASDNIQWVLAQTETEAMTLKVAALLAEGADASALGEVRLRYDVLFSRIETLNTSPIYADLRADKEYAASLDRLVEFRDKWLPIMDGPDGGLAEALPRVVAETNEVRQAARRMALEGINEFSAQRDKSRKAVADTLLRIALLTVCLILLLLIMVSALNRVARMRQIEAEGHRITRERAETILSTSLDAVIVTDKDGVILDFNGAATKVFGYDRDEAVGSQMADLIIPDHMRSAHARGMENYNRTREKHVIGAGIVQLEAKGADGKIFPVDLSLARAQSDRGEIFIGFIRDISDRVAAENTLRDARDRAIAGEKSKAELLAVMSHEMRTPLNGMLGTLDLIDYDSLDARHRRYMRIIRNSGNVLLGHVNDVLDVSRLDSGRFSLSKQSFDLVDLLEEIVDTLHPRAAENNNKLVIAPTHPDFHHVYSDPSRLRQILLNLVGNAIKFTRNGRIIIEADCSDGLNKAEIRVVDNGSGIAEEDLSRIFDDFVTIDASYKRSNSGTGLGLGISRRLALALGGELGAESEIGDGSVFFIKLPLDPPNKVGQERSLATGTERDLAKAFSDTPGGDTSATFQLPPLNVLVVEDNAVNRMIVREMLARDSHKVSEAHNGEEGVAMAMQGGYDVILMDISMPGMDGITATRLIRAAESDLTADVPIIATTAHALPEEIRTFLEAGMNDVLVKPLSINALRKVLAQTLSLPANDDTVPACAAEEDEESSNTIDAQILETLVTDLPKPQLQEAIRILVSEVDKFIADMPATGDSPEDRKALAAEAHRLAGSTGVFGMLGMMELMRLVQVQAPDMEQEDVEDIHEAIVSTWRDTRTELNQSAFAAALGLVATVK